MITNNIKKLLFSQSRRRIQRLFCFRIFGGAGEGLGGIVITIREKN